MTLRSRMALASGAVLAVVILAASAAIYLSMRAQLRGQVYQSLVTAVDRLEQDATAPTPPPGRSLSAPVQPPPGAGPTAPPPLPNLRERSRRAPFGSAPGYVQFVRPDGTAQRAPDEVDKLPVSARARQIAQRGRGELVEETRVGKTHLLVLTRGIGSGAVQAARPLDEVNRVLRRALVVLASVWVVGIALAGLLGLLIARTALRPIAVFTRQYEDIATTGDATARLNEDGNDELARLASTYNATLDALERSVAVQRNLVADASHELRTPIASLRANIQMLEQADRLPDDEVAALREDIITELDELTALITDIVELARDADPESTPRPRDVVPVHQLLERVVARAERRGDRHLSYECQTEPTLVSANPDRLERAVSNLIDNARKWSPPDGTIHISLSNGALTVRDEGPGFHEQDLPNIFDRFYRSAAARGTSGSGLGLAIVHQTVTDIGGTVEASNHRSGGAVVTITLPQLAHPNTPTDG